jgi:hypothetical protein
MSQMRPGFPDPDDEDDSGITGWEQGDADRQLVPDGGVTISDEGLARFGRAALVIGMIVVVAYMVVHDTGR